VSAYRLRPTTGADRERIYELKREAFRGYVELLGGWDEAWERRHFDEGWRRDAVQVIEVGGEIAGFVQLEPEPPAVRIRNVALAPAWRGRGIGSALIARLARETAGPLRLRVFADNPAVALYRRLGFEVLGEVDETEVPWNRARWAQSARPRARRGDEVRVGPFQGGATKAAVEKASPASSISRHLGQYWLEMERAPLGLADGAVRLAAHDPGWARAYDTARRRIEAALGPLGLRGVEHVGSTSVADLDAKPIVDVVARMPIAADGGAIIAALAAAGYLDRGDKGDDGGHLFARELEPGVRTEHLHVVRDGDGMWEIYLRFRALLRSDPEARRRYLELKRRLAAEHPGDRERYTAAKAELIRALLAGD
jgi:GrpB-like predicted nucleotidyltransferase (UPF0157 family)/ribosomal protein S18 acetylase RimI-like enzyme